MLRLNCWRIFSLFNIADAFARDSRLTIIRSEERQTLAAIRGLNIEGLSIIDGIEPEIPGEVKN